MKYLVAIAACLLAALSASAGPASAAPNPVSLEFTTGQPYREYANSVSRFTAQVDFRTVTLAWSLEMTPSTQAVIAGTMNCQTKIEGIQGYVDDHRNLPPDYLLHSSVKVQRGKNYKLRSRCDFKALTNTGMQPGNVETAVDFVVR